MSQELQKQETKPLFGVVVFYHVWRNETTGERRLGEIGRTDVLPYHQALHVYCETPNPASQMIKFEDVNQQVLEEARLQSNIRDPQWLKHLFEQI